MSDKITTLHPYDDDSTNVYPNIKSENIPDGSVTESKLDPSIVDEINNLSEKYTKTVTTNTEQQITAQKTFTQGIKTNKVTNINGYDDMNDDGSNLNVGNSSRELKLSGSTTKPTYNGKELIFADEIANNVTTNTTQTITGAKTFTDLAGYFTNGMTIKNSTNGLTKKLVVEPFYYTQDPESPEIELEIGWMYLIVPWYTETIKFKATNTADGDVTITTNTGMGLGFANVWIYPGTSNLGVQTSYTDVNTGKPGVIGTQATSESKVYLVTSGWGMGNCGLRMKWVD